MMNPLHLPFIIHRNFAAQREVDFWLQNSAILQRPGFELFGKTRAGSAHREAKRGEFCRAASKVDRPSSPAGAA
jgi:hypothetical protein